jgi:hypothetical protein
MISIQDSPVEFEVSIGRSTVLDVIQRITNTLGSTRV